MQATRSPLTSAAILGVLVALWHLPLVGDTGSIARHHLPITFVYVWLFNRTGGSVLLILLIHVTQGYVTMPIWATPVPRWPGRNCSNSSAGPSSPSS